jgi:hypothetical protein
MTPATYLCPFCRTAIRMDDVNVATDLALCRACGKTSSFAMVAGGVQFSPDILRTPPRGIQVGTDFRGNPTISYRRLSPVLLFLIPFTLFWSGFSMWGIYGSQIRKGHFEWGPSLFGLPFLFGTVILVTVISFLLFGRWVVTLENGTGTVFAGIGKLGWRRTFTFNRTSTVCLRTTTVQKNGVPQQAICVRTGEKDFTFGTGLRREAQEYFAAAILQAAPDFP